MYNNKNTSNKTNAGGIGDDLLKLSINKNARITYDFDSY